MIKSVLKSEKGMVIVFDGRKKQMPEYQGQYDEVREKILRDAPPDALFGRITTGIQAVPREEW